MSSDVASSSTQELPSPTSIRQYEPAFQQINVFHLMMDGIGSERAGIYGNGFNLKSFARTEPPLQKNSDDASHKHENSPVATVPSGSSQTKKGHPPFGKDISFQKTDSFFRWSLVTPRESWQVLPQEDRSKSLFLRIYNQIHEGCTWDVFRGEMGLSDFSDRGRLQPIVLKLTRLSAFREARPDDPTFWDDERDNCRYDVEENIVNEDYILRQHLKALQGEVVPYYYGMFIWREHDEIEREDWVIGMLMEDAGNPFGGYTLYYPFEDKQQVLSCYKMLHKEAKVAHRNVAWHHILKRAKEGEEEDDKQVAVKHSKITLIDFQAAVHFGALELDARREREHIEFGIVLVKLYLQMTLERLNPCGINIRYDPKYLMAHFGSSCCGYDRLPSEQSELLISLPILNLTQTDPDQPAPMLSRCRSEIQPSHERGSKSMPIELLAGGFVSENLENADEYRRNADAKRQRLR